MYPCRRLFTLSNPRHVNKFNRLCSIKRFFVCQSRDSEVTVALKGFTCKRRIGLTGTALQNSMKELWCLLDW